MSMDFHPSHHTLLLGISMCIGDLCQMIIWEYITAFLSPSLTYCVIWTVGSVNGEITLWELISRERLFSKPFKIWDMSACSLQFQVLSDILLYCTCTGIFSSHYCCIFAFHGISLLWLVTWEFEATNLWIWYVISCRPLVSRMPQFLLPVLHGVLMEILWVCDTC